MTESTTREADYSKEEDSIDSQTVCLVCSDKSDGTHFGIDSCRACAAFFRRSVIGAKKYSCRQGKNACLVSRKIKSMCRRCRLYKCLTSGMKPESVRDPLPVKSVTRPPVIFASTSLETDELLSAFRRVKPVPIHPDPARDASFSLLSTISQNYKQLTSVRRATELAIDKETAGRIFHSDDPFKGLTQGTLNKLSLFYRAHLSATGDFIENSFPEFKALDQKDKWVIFQPFVIHFWGIDNAYRTWNRIPEHLLANYCIMSETLYVCTDNILEFFPEKIKNSANSGETQRMFLNVFGRPRLTVVNAFRRLDPSEEEYAAIIGLMIWMQCVEKGCDKIDALGSMMRDKIYEQLHHYYTSRGVHSYAKRLGEIHCIESCVIQFGNLIKEFSEIFHMMDIFENDSFIHDFMKMA